METLNAYFLGDTMALDAWCDKYQMRDREGNPVELLPSDMHRRMANEFARIEYGYINQELRSNPSQLSEFGAKLLQKRVFQSESQIADELFSYFDKFGKIVPQGGIMSNLGNPYVFGSLSNCFVVNPPKDSYGSIFRADQEMTQLCKRRGGVGTHLSFLRPDGARTSNAAKTSTGAWSFASRYSNSIREVAQKGRRGALMLLLHVQHPDIFKWVRMKSDLTKVTGANVSVIFNNDFMQKVDSGEETFICKFPINDPDPIFEHELKQLKEYNKLYEIDDKYFMKINPTELFEEFVNMAWSNAEPGAAYIDTIVGYSPDGVYTRYCPQACNPCGEQWFSPDDACRLLALNLLGMVMNLFKKDAQVDMELLYECAFMMQRLGDNLVDLEIEHIDRIITKITTKVGSDEDDIEEARTEINLWNRIRRMANDGRRTGNGFTALGDMLAAINVKYGSDESLIILEEVMKTKMRAELDATIDMALTRGTFTGWDADLEFYSDEEGNVEGANDFYQMLVEEFPEQAFRMYSYGRRNVSWSTVAPTGTVSVMTQTTSGLEPLFAAYYTRRRKINPEDIGARIDFTDEMGDMWQEYPVLHPQFKKWIEQTTIFKGALENEQVIIDMYSSVGVMIKEKVKIQVAEDLPKNVIQKFFEYSPWFEATANDIPWEKRIQMQSIIQRYTSNAISSTINLPRDVEKDVVANIYMEAWRSGLKGVTIYRDGSRDGVLITENSNITKDEFGYVAAKERPESLEGEYHIAYVDGKKYAVVVGMMNNLPYEVFAFHAPNRDTECKGTIRKVASKQYEFVGDNYIVENLQFNDKESERVLTRWASLSLRQGTHPKEIIDQVEKSEVNVTSFAKSIAMILKKYIPDEATGETCDNCHEHTMVYQEGCKTCSSCGSSKC